MVRTRHHPGTLRDEGDSPVEFLSLETKSNRRSQKQTGDDYNSDDSGVVPVSRRGRSTLDHQPPFQSRLRPKIRSSGAYFIGEGISSDEDDSPSRSRSSPRKMKRKKAPMSGGKGVKVKSVSSPEVDYDEDQEDEIEIDENNSSRRRSTRQRKMTYDTLNQNFLDKAIVSTNDEDQDSDKKKRKSDLMETSDKEEFSDMYSRVKRQRKLVQRDMYGVPVQESDSSSTSETDDDDQEDDKPQKRSYYLREHKPRTHFFEAPPIESQKKKQPAIFRAETPPRSTRRLDSHQTYRSPAHKKIVRKRAAFHVTDSTSSECLSSDEERFQRRKAKSMARSRARCLPMNFKPEDMTSGVRKDRMRLGASLADIDPMAIDRTVSFNSIGGLGKHIRALKEMIVFPIMYPEIFERFNISPPRGVLFHGPPGTGKTLVARALANECSTGNKKVAFFMRKGADCLSKWVGESERQLRLLFDQAYQVRPAIIFFDEIDGLAPVRSSRQDQIHSSIVSTLLALMDGLDSRGEIVVIGATNRIDSIDPALRRPGRFDREFLFPLPSEEARKHILKIHTKAWNPKLSDQFIGEVAQKCVGYCGADLKALCTEAALQASRRRYPQIYTSNEKLQLNVSSIHVSAKDFFKGMQAIVPTSQRSVGTPSRALSHAVDPLLKKQFKEAIVLLHEVFPSILAKLASLDAPDSSGAEGQPGAVTLDEMASDDDEEGPSIYDKGRNNKRSSQESQQHYLGFSRQSYHCPTTYRPRMLLCGERGQGQTSHLGPAVIHHMEQLPVHVLDLPTVYAATAKTPEESCAQVFHEAKRTSPSIVYMPYINQWWEVLNDTLRATFLTLIQNLDPATPILILASSEIPYADMDSLLQILFSMNSGEVMEMRDPCAEERREYFQDLLLNQAVRPPAVKKQAALRLLEVLPKALPPPPPKLTEAEVRKLYQQEEATLRELRIFLRDVLNKLGRDRKFGIFTKPVDVEEVPDYYDIIRKPMDLSTMMSKIDLGQYQTVAEFLDDINQICLNALEYNPDRGPNDRSIRHRACALRDTAQAIIEAELNPEFERQCQNIEESRIKRGIERQTTVPDFYFTKPPQRSNDPQQEGTIAKPLPPTPQGVRCSRRVRGKDAEDTPSLEHVEKQWHVEKRINKDTQEDSCSPQNKDTPVLNKRQQTETPSSAKTIRSTPQSSQKKSKARKKCIWAGTKRRRRKKTQKALLRMDNPEEEISDDSDSEIVIAESPRRDTHDMGSSQPSTSGKDSSQCSPVSNILSSKKSPPTSRCLDLLPGHDSGMGSSVDSNGDSVDSVEHAREKDRKQLEQQAVNLVDLVEEGSPEQGGKFRITRSRLQTREQQQALELLEESLPPLTVDVPRLQRLLDKVVIVTETYNLERLEKLYSVFSQCIYRHRKAYDKTPLTEELESKLDQHCQPVPTS